MANTKREKDRHREKAEIAPVKTYLKSFNHFIQYIDYKKSSKLSKYNHKLRGKKVNNGDCVMKRKIMKYID